MTRHSVSHPSDAELRELRTICGELLSEALSRGSAVGLFHGWRIHAIANGAPTSHVGLFMAHDGVPLYAETVAGERWRPPP